MQAIKLVPVLAGQNIWDIAQQEYKSPEGVILILQANPGLSVTDELAPGRVLNIWTEKAIQTLIEIISVQPFGSQLHSILQAWALLVATTPGGGGGTTTEIQSGFGVKIQNLITNLYLDDLHLSENIRNEDLLIFIYPDATGTARYRKIPLSAILSMMSFTGQLRDLDDVSLSDVQLNDLLKFDGENWVNDRVLGIGGLTIPDFSTLLYYDTVNHRFRWLNVGNGLQLIEDVLQVNPELFADQIWKKSGTNIEPSTAGDDLNLGEGNLSAKEINASAYSAGGDQGLSTTLNMLTGISFDGIETMKITQQSVTYKAGLLINVTAGADINLTIPRPA